MKPIIYQVFPRWYGNRNLTRKHCGTIEENGCGKLADFTPSVLKHLRQMGITHVWYTGVIRHATMTDYSHYGIPRQHPAVVKGRAGSPYAIADYYDVDPDLAVNPARRMDEFERLVARTHRAGLKVVIDFVPNHVARQYKSIARPEGVRDFGADDDVSKGFTPKNDFYYCPGLPFEPYFDRYHGELFPYEEMPAKATGNDHFDNAPGRDDWYETVKLNYGVDYYAGRIGHFDPTPSLWQKMLHVLLFWASKGVDAFRCDMVFMVPVEFWRWVIPQVRAEYPDVLFIGEIYDPWLYRDFIAAGFDWLYDKVGMYDALRDITCHRRRAADITSQWQQLDDIRSHMLYFLENHDEQRLASDFFAADGRKAVPALIVSAMLGENAFMLYAGQEYGERGMDCEGFSGHDGRTTIFDYWSVDTLCRADSGELTPDEQSLYEQHRSILNIARKEKAVTDGVMFDLMYVNQHIGDRQYAFLRKAEKDLLLVVANFADEDATADVCIPRHAFDYLHLAEGSIEAKDLLSGSRMTLTLEADKTVRLSLPPRGGCILKMTF
ncbi:MAG: alpha-amylase [Prevotella sp.]|nr:alpha-amylase [Prevotella sp.]